MQNQQTEKLTLSDVEVLYDLHFESIYRFFYFKLLNKEVAEDLTGETFLSLTKAAKSNHEIENPRAYLYGIARNLFWKFLRQKYSQPISLDNLPEDFANYVHDFLEEQDQTETTEDVALKFIKKLPPRQQDILYWRLIDKLTLKEIVEKTGKDMNYVKTTQKRGIRKLRELIAIGEHTGKDDYTDESTS